MKKLNILLTYQTINLLTPATVAFTMAEILLSLTIIGVVAAITLPSLTGNINERTWNTQRKALYARVSQAISLMPALNGYGQLKEESSSGAGDAVDTAAETFITDGLSKVLKINNICDNEHLADCGIPTSYTDMLGSKKALPTTLYTLNDWFRIIRDNDGHSYATKDSKAVGFETQNGESLVVYYNRTCRTEYFQYQCNNPSQYWLKYYLPESTMCVNFIYDLNGNKGPNTIGKDIGFITAFRATDSVVVAPIPSAPQNTKQSVGYKNITKVCTDENPESRTPNLDELSAMLINKDFINLTSDYGLWSSNLNIDSVWFAWPQRGWTQTSMNGTHGFPARCIYR